MVSREAMFLIVNMLVMTAGLSGRYGWGFLLFNLRRELVMYLYIATVRRW